MIDKRILEEIARERGLGLEIIEKDWVLGWLLYGISRRAPELAFMGGTALSKVYFPKIWRLSEDLDFTLINRDASNEEIISQVRDAFTLTENLSGIKLETEKPHANPGYIQMKVNYAGPISRGTVKIDIRRHDPTVDGIRSKDLLKAYLDYLPIKIKVKTREEILASKLVALTNRDKVRDYYDVWLLLKETEVNVEKAKTLLPEYEKHYKVKVSEDKLFPKGIEETLETYWNRDIKRLANPKTTLKEVLRELKEKLKEHSVI